jgi:energy-coupling factor transporter ATP-binding protein EcfA2
MEFSLTNFTIVNLHGDTTIEIDINDNKLIIVADNGIGKTTIVNIIYYTLSKQWYKLTDYVFDRIDFTVNGFHLAFTRADLTDYIKLKRLNRGLSKNYSTRVSSIMDKILEMHDPSRLLRHPGEMERVAERYGMPVQVLFNLLNNITSDSNSLSVFDDITLYLNQNIKSQILYLPTYRRIEKDLKNIFPELDTDLDDFRKRRQAANDANQNKFIELVDFGMDDVHKKITSKLNTLYLNFSNNTRQTLMGSFLKDVLNKTYEELDYDFISNITSEDLGYILNRIDNSILQVNEKTSLREFVERYKSDPQSLTNEDKIIGYFIKKIIDIYEKQSIEEKDVNIFVELCNQYCINKKFVYAREERQIKIYLIEQEKEIFLPQLSSGEKQIVSLFSHLYLSETKSFFVIIDEPELSLSVSWQERFLNDILNAYNAGLIAVTHSPFTFSSNLRRNTRAVNEFLRYNN